MLKTLKNYTIIPPSLYVERSADRQLRTIIEDMGRPGYVLVSRQMGKTNLLLNAKRQLESIDTIFVYVDLSTLFDTARHCFRNIVDLAIKSQPQLFEMSRRVIADSRVKNQGVPPNAEHENELLHLLTKYEGKLVIVLDEIDALTSCDFSDQVFAQIRSVYFAGRTNYHEFDRLTYVLSGVAEPSSLIKDKNKSPFNIGDKIYLDDFSFKEFADFITKAGLTFKDDVIAKVYDYTSGHPRMTWDVCSRLEDIVRLKGHTCCDDVNTCIYELYTKDYDRAPIDNIRDLVGSNYEIRKSVKSLICGNGNVSDDLKITLYLAGIIKSDYGTTRKVIIKNKIISDCLRLDWLDSIDVKNKSYINLATEQETLGRFEEAIKYYLAYLKTNSVEDVHTRGIVLTAIGNCYFTLKKYDDAISYFKEAISEGATKSNEYYYKNMFKIGIIYLKQKLYDKSLDMFNEIRNKSNIDVAIRYGAAVNYVTVLLEMDFETNKEAALSILSEMAVDVYSIENDSQALAVDALVVMHYNLGNILKTVDKVNDAILNLQKALKISPPRYQPFLYRKIIDCSSGADEITVQLRACTDTILKNCIKFSKEESLEESISQLDFTKNILLGFIVSGYQYHCRDVIDSLTLHYKNIVEEELDDRHILREVLNNALSCRNFTTATKIATELLHFTNEEESPQDLITLHKLLCNLKMTTGSDSSSDALQYVALFGKYKGIIDRIEYDDILTLTIALSRLSAEGRLTEAVKAMDAFESFYEGAKGEVKVHFYVTFFLISRLSLTLGYVDEASKYAKKAVKVANEVPSNLAKLLTMDQVLNIGDFFGRVLMEEGSRLEPTVQKSLGRNDKCFCGSGKKYKKCHGR